MADDRIELVQKFVDTFKQTQSALDSSDMDSAKNGYKDLLGVYSQISSSNLDPMHKELAYDQLVKVYQALQNPPRQSIHATTHIIAAAVLLMLFSFLVFFKPTVLGLAALESQRTVHDLNWAFVESDAREVHLDKVPSSLRLSGRVDGEGFVRVYAITPTSRVLIFDDDLARTNADGSFSGACARTCSEGLDSADFTLDVVVENAAVTLYSLEYT
jgi:hypothetical protein